MADVRVRRDDGVAWLTFDRPPLNVLNIALLDSLAEALEGLIGDRELRLIAIEGAGRLFSAGVDVGEHLGNSLGPMLDSFARVSDRILASEVPTLAIVRGAALGGACELVALCDLALVADDAKLGVPEITLGVVPPVAAALFPRLVGAQRAAALVLTGEPITGSEAAACGLVWRSVPADRLADAALAIAELFRRRSASALRLARRTIREVAALPLEEALRAAKDIQLRELPDIEDAREGLTAFLEKRAPAWTHR